MFAPEPGVTVAGTYLHPAAYPGAPQPLSHDADLVVAQTAAEANQLAALLPLRPAHQPRYALLPNGLAHPLPIALPRPPAPPSASLLQRAARRIMRELRQRL
ncbi:MAG: hypothetical protein SF029_01010 [bacterium]|nr:hypothetical protein [bacterium]